MTLCSLVVIQCLNMQMTPLWPPPLKKPANNVLLLRCLTEQGHRASLVKLKFCEPKVNTHKAEMHSFLKMTNCCWHWIHNYSAYVLPLKAWQLRGEAGKLFLHLNQPWVSQTTTYLFVCICMRRTMRRLIMCDSETLVDIVTTPRSDLLQSAIGNSVQVQQKDPQRHNIFQVML